MGVLLGLELTLNPFSHYPAYREIAHLPFADRVARLRDPAFRARLLADDPERRGRGFASAWGGMYLMSDGSRLRAQREDPPSPSTPASAGISPEEVVARSDAAAHEGRGMLYVPFLNYADGSLDAVHEMIANPDTVPGLSDGGAHVGMICDGSFPTSLLTHWTRDRTRGPKLDLPM